MLEIRLPVLERAAEGGITLFSAPPGYFSTDHLAGLFAEQGRSVVWLRIGVEDRDPGTLLTSLIQAARMLAPEIGETTLDQMVREAGPVSGWSNHFASLAREWSAILPRPGALVIQHLDLISKVPGLLDLLGTHFLQILPEFIPKILITHQSLPHLSLPGSVIERNTADLRLDIRGARILTSNSDIDLPAPPIQRILDISGGRASALIDLLQSSRILGEETVFQFLAKSNHFEAWMVKIARAWLSSVKVEALQALALTMRLGYSHPSLLQVAIGDTAAPGGPWIQELGGGWSRIHCVWEAPLSQALRAGIISEHTTLHRAAQFLAANGSTELAVPSLLELGDLDGAGEAIAASAEGWMDRGQWQMLAEWIGQLPLTVLENWPWLIYYSGEIIASQGHIDSARKAFSKAKKYFESQGDKQGQCRAMLAENTLAAWQNDLAFAQNSALDVLSIARGYGMDQVIGLAAWQAGCLAVVKGSLKSAVDYFAQAGTAARIAGDEWMAGLCNRAENMAFTLDDLLKQNEHYRQAYFDTQQASHEIEQQLRLLLSDPTHGLNSNAVPKLIRPSPVLLKIPAPEQSNGFFLEAGSRNLLALLFGSLGIFRRKWSRKEEENPIPVRGNPPNPGPVYGRVTPFSFHETGKTTYMPVPGQVLPGIQPPGRLPEPVISPVISNEDVSHFEPENEEAEWEPQQEQVDGSDTKLRLSIHLLGPLNVRVNDHQVIEWPSNKCRAVFTYLVAHHQHAISRDVLMDVLWPEASLKAARNNLNVSLYALRRALRTASETNLVIYRTGAYSLAPEVELWLDVDEFERYVQEGRQYEANRDHEAAARAYETAAQLYQGDFLSDDLYEEWPITLRQHLRLAYQEILDSLSQHYFQLDQFTSCISMCQILLSYDNCREDIHCRLMRCYSRQGLDHLALRQYQICEGALREDLEVTPTETTTQLYEQIRRHERV